MTTFATNVEVAVKTSTRPGWETTDTKGTVTSIRLTVRRFVPSVKDAIQWFAEIDSGYFLDYAPEGADYHDAATVVEFLRRNSHWTAAQVRWFDTLLYSEQFERDSIDLLKVAVWGEDGETT